MVNPNLLLRRLSDIGESLESSGHALALIGLGSVGTEVERLDAHSDLDFFAIVEEGYKGRYIVNLDWLSGIAPVAYQFRNTADGYKLLYADGIFCEFAVFEPHELQGIPFSARRVVWKRPHIQDSITVPARKGPSGSKPGVEWQVGEALTNLLIGLKRFRRGEKLSGSRFVQNYALDRVLDLAGLVETETPYFEDEFGNDRRFERRFPKTAALLPSFAQGYDRTPESALAILEFLEEHFEVNATTASEIRTLISDHPPEQNRRQPMALNQKLVDAATELLNRRFPGTGGVAAAMYIDDGRILTGVSFNPEWGGGGLCAEAGPVCEAAKLGRRVLASACVSRLSGDGPVVILTPCGICQERLFHWGPGVEVAVPHPDDPTRWVAKTLEQVQPFHWVNVYVRRRA